MTLTLLLGGARSGKSSLAVEMGRRRAAAGQAVVVIATAPAVDADMAARIAAHRAGRPDWPTIEEPLDLAGALRSVPPGAFAIVDCLTLWVSNLMWRGDDDASIESLAGEVADVALRVDCAVVSNEVGLGVHPETDLGRRYRDLLGRVNACWASRSQRSLLLVAGRALPLIDPWEIL